MVVSLKSFALQHPYLIMKTVVVITVLAVALLANPAAATKILIIDEKLT